MNRYKARMRRGAKCQRTPRPPDILLGWRSPGSFIRCYKVASLAAIVAFAVACSEPTPPTPEDVAADYLRGVADCIEVNVEAISNNPESLDAICPFDFEGLGADVQPIVREHGSPIIQRAILRESWPPGSCRATTDRKPCAWPLAVSSTTCERPRPCRRQLSSMSIRHLRATQKSRKRPMAEPGVTVQVDLKDCVQGSTGFPT